MSDNRRKRNKNVDYKVSVRIKDQTLKMINYITDNSSMTKSDLIRLVLEPHIEECYDHFRQAEIDNRKFRLRGLLKDIIDENESLGLDSEEDKVKLVNELAKALSPGDWDDLQVVTQALFPHSEVGEDNTEQLVIYTGIYNGGPSSDDPILCGSPNGFDGNFSDDN